MAELHVIFGTGPLGKWTARELARLGKQVRMINRSGKADRLPESIEVVASDAYDVKKNIEVTQGASAIYHPSATHFYLCSRLWQTSSNAWHARRSARAGLVYAKQRSTDTS